MKQYQGWAEETLKKVREKMEWVSEKNRAGIPYTTDENGNYDDRSIEENFANPDDGLNWWTNGFWSGLMWLLYQDGREDRYKEIARVSEEKLEKCFTDYYGLHHDVGFMYLLTSGADYRLTGNARARRDVLHAASLLAGRFNPVGRFIRAWNDSDRDDTRGWAIIDCMMNLPLLYFASEESKDPRYKHIAMMHADTAMKNFVRADGSVCHIVEFDPETGEMVKSYGGQGYAEGSAWTRGQAWGLYGFVNSFLHTGKQSYLDTAKKIADYCVAHIPDSGIIPVDFCQPEEPAWEDSCGACIMAAGLLELAKQLHKGTEESPEGAVYAAAAVKILKAIAETRADWTTGCDAIVQNCSAAYHDQRHHFTMVYADYFFIEALYKITGQGILLW